MRDQVQREIERRDARDGAEWKSLHDTPASGRVLLPIEGKVLAINARGFFRRNVEDEYGAVHFSARQFDGLAGFLRQGAGKFFTALGHGLRHAPQHALALEGRQAAGGSKSLDGGGDRSRGMLAPGLDDSPNHAAIEGRADFDEIAVFHPSAVDEETVGCDWGNRQFRHLLPPGCRQRF